MVQELANKVSNDLAKKLDEWLLSQCGSIENAKNYRLKCYTDYNGFQIEYTLYPRRGRNAKKPISKFVYKYFINTPLCKPKKKKL